jgi:hypothetical protein
MRWGFADARAKTPLERPRHMHARAETIDRLPTFADAFAHARGLVPVKTFKVGEELPNGRVKQWVITPRDGSTKKYLRAVGARALLRVLRALYGRVSFSASPRTKIRGQSGLQRQASR